jgi:hypothetical protein
MTVNDEAIALSSSIRAATMTKPWRCWDSTILRVGRRLWSPAEGIAVIFCLTPERGPEADSLRVDSQARSAGLSAGIQMLGPWMSPRFLRQVVMVGLLSLLGGGKPAMAEVDGNAVIQASFQGTPISITTTQRLAGAIHSLRWQGMEFIDSADHGRQLQSACSFDVGDATRFWAEAYNPTEAGSRLDGAGETSSSRLLRLSAQANHLETESQMAFWLAPGETSQGHPALNTMILSRHRLQKRVHIGFEGWPNVIDYRATFFVPAAERHTYAQFEALTGYMPSIFSVFWRYEPQLGKRLAIDDGPGEQACPLIFSTVEGDYAMGIFSPSQPVPGDELAGYGRFRFPEAKVVKWNCVFRERAPEGIPPGSRTFRMLVVIGSLATVEQTMGELIARFAVK